MHAPGAAWLFALVMMRPGGLAIWDAHFVKATKRGVTVATHGVSAQWLGGLQINPGLTMLFLAMPHSMLPCPGCWPVVRWERHALCMVIRFKLA